METIKIKTKKGEGTIQEWYAAQEMTQGQFVYVADNDGNWADTVWLNQMERTVLRYKQAWGAEPIITTIRGNAFYDEDGNYPTKEKCEAAGLIYVGRYNRPYVRVQHDKPPMSSYAQINSTWLRMKDIRNLALRAKREGYVVFGRTVNNAYYDRHVRVLNLPKEAHKAAFSSWQNGATISYKPNGEKVKYSRPYMRLGLGSGFSIPKSIKGTITITAEQGERFLKFYDDSKEFMGRILAERKLEQTKANIKWNVKELVNKTQTYNRRLSEVKEAEAQLDDNLRNFAHRQLHGRAIAEAMMGYYKVEGDIDEFIEYYTKRHAAPKAWGLEYAYARKIARWTVDINRSCPLTKLKQMRGYVADAERQCRRFEKAILKDAPIGGGTLIKEALNEKYPEVHSLDGFFAVFKVGEEE